MSTLLRLASISLAFVPISFNVLIGTSKAVAALSKNSFTPMAYLYDSDMFHPEPAQKLRELIHLTYLDRLDGKYVQIRYKDQKPCRFSSHESDWSKYAQPKCLLALQIYYSTTKAIIFFEKIGFQLSYPVTIHI